MQPSGLRDESSARRPTQVRAAGGRVHYLQRMKVCRRYEIAIRGHGEAIMESIKLVESILVQFKQVPESVARADFLKHERSGRFPR